MRQPAWSLVQFVLANDTSPQVGILVGERVHRPPDPLAGRSLLDVVEDWAASRLHLERWSPESAEIVLGATLVAPLTFPRKVLCAGANYYGHLAEMGIAAPATPPAPFFFFKPPTTTVIATGESIPLPTAAAKVDWEAELGVVIASRCRDVAPADVLDHVAGYLPVNDISARDLLGRADAVAPPFGFDWLGAKAHDGFCPIGPGLVPAWMVGDLQQILIRLSVNGVIKQDSSTADMISPVVDLIAAISRTVTLEPGDIVLTGTPAGVGVARGEFLAHGDEVVVEIDQVGRLVNTVVSA